MMRHLILRLDAPLMSFGAEMVDAYGVVRDFPARSAITGVLANALGWERYQAELHDRLQSRLVMGAARLREGIRIQDYQTALLASDTKGWTTHGQPEGRNKDSPSFTYDWENWRRTGRKTKNLTHIRYRDVDADACVLVALRLDPADESPTLDDLTEALDRPERPLFIGRKPFLPSCRINAGIVVADTIVGALTNALAGQGARAQWPRGEGPDERTRIVELTDERHWQAGVHTGLTRAVEGRIPAATEA